MVLLYEGGGTLLFPLLSKNIMLFPNIVVSKGSYVDYSHQQLWGVINRFICIVDNSQDRLVVV